MGHKHSTLHRQLKQQDAPNHDLVTAVDSGGGPGNSLAGNSAPTPFFEVKQGPFRRKLSVRNISIRRSFHVPKKSHKRLNQVAATTDDIAGGSSGLQRVHLPSSSSTPNGGLATATEAITSVPVPSTSTSTPTPVSLPRAASFSRNGDKHVMDRIRKSFRNSFRRKKSIPESIKPHQWQSDEVAVKAGNCMFSVKYLGCVEVFESRGMQICEDALRRLRNSRRRAVKGTLYVTGDGLRVVDDETKGLIVDQTIEKVSFCAPDRSHERGFSYICRDGTTRRWMCHGFHATKDSGERLSHAVGCAFAVCLERKQRRDKEAVSSVFDAKTATFTRTGSFRQSSITERMQDPQVAKAAEPPPLKPVHNPYAVERPHAAASLLQRQGSLRGGPLNHASPFKRQLSLRLGIDSLPTSLNSPAESTTTTLTNAAANSTLSNQRERAHSVDFTAKLENSNTTTTPLKRPVPSSLFQLGSKVTLAPSVAPIQEVSPNQDKSSNSILTHGTSSNEGGSSIIAAMCQELSQGLSILAAKTDDDLVSGSHPFPPSPGHFSPPAALGAGSGASFSAFDKWISTNSNGSKRPADNKPLVPPPVVDQMPQVTAPPPPSSPSYATTVTFSTQFNKSKATDYHSSLFSDLANSLKDNLANSSGLNSTCPVSSTAPSTSSPTSISTSSVSAIPTAATTTCSHNGSSDKSPSGKLDPFDADWVELSNRHMPTHVDANETVSTSAVDSCSTSSSSMFNSSTVPAVPYKSTNPFLDLSQFETASTAAAVNLPSAPPPSQPQQLITAFEVQM